VRNGGAPKGGAVWVREREIRALELRTAGLPYRRIGQQLGVGESMARRIVARGLDRLVREPAAALIALETSRLDLLWETALTNALAGSARWAEVAVRVLERRARMLGLDAPTRTEVHMTSEEVDALDAEIEALLAHYHHPDGDQ
jgi:hypothetical protein